MPFLVLLALVFVTPAYAQSTAGGLQDLLSSPLPMMVGLAAIFYFLWFRPEQAQRAKRDDMLAKIRRGDTVVLGGGIMGKVNRVRDDDPLIDVEIAKGTIVQVLRASVSEVRVKGEPVKDAAATG